MFAIDRTSLDQLLRVISDDGYTLIAPTVRNGSIIHEIITSIKDLPVGWTDVQGPASYALERRSDDALFGYAVGPSSWKKFLFPSRVKLFEAKKDGKTFAAAGESSAPAPRYAFIGVRPCELHAIRIQDTVFMNGEFSDPVYTAIRKNLFIVAVNCVEAGQNCFCASMGTGPSVQEGFDIVITELLDKSPASYMVETGTERGKLFLEKISAHPAEESDRRRVAAATKRAAEGMTKTLDTKDIKELLYQNLEHVEWDAVAKRCLACTNCTLVCPTCFCSTVEDLTDLSGDHATRWKRWDSCFTAEFTKVAGGNFRPSVRARYRQWLTHKLASWQDQFGTSGCVGCGRCITWCPAGIDLTEEIWTIREQSSSGK